MKIKKISKIILQNVNLKNILIFSSGFLIPIYSDLIFIHEFDSGTVSAIMDTITASVAVLAAIGLKGWLNEKMRIKGVDHGTILLTQLAKIKLSLSQLVVYLHSAYEIALATPLEVRHKNVESFKEKITSLFLVNSNEFVSISLNADMLSHWGMNISDEHEKNFVDYMDSIKKLMDLSNKSIIFLFSTENQLETFWENEAKYLPDMYSNVKIQHDKISVTFDKFFTYLN